MTAKRKSFQTFVYAGLLLLATGCSGINASKTISPLDFILPGLLKAEPQPTPTDLMPLGMNTAKQVALLQ